MKKAKQNLINLLENELCKDSISEKEFFKIITLIELERR